MGDSYIYVASDGETSKIGMTNNPRFRMTKLRSATKSEYQALKLWQSDKETASKIEKEVIECMSNYCSKGKEWFSVPGHRLVSVVEGIIKRRNFCAEQCDINDPFAFALPDHFQAMAEDISDITSQPFEEAIRYAISFCHKQLTEVINPEDLGHE